MHKLSLSLPLASIVLLVSNVAWAGNITAQGAVTALDDVSQLDGIVGTASYDEGVGGQSVPLGQYTAQGMTFHIGALTAILPGVVAAGSASQPLYQAGNNYFPAPIAGGGVANGTFTYFGGAVTFDQPITQIGLTASRNGTQYLTVWDTNGQMIGQVTWQPANDAAFIGIDTNGVAIGMATYGNDDVWNGVAYNIGGSTIISDTWIWASGSPCQSDEDCVDDDNECTAPVVCDAGACVHAPLDGEACTDDGNACTDDVCSGSMCTHPNNSDPCDDGDACTVDDICGGGSCGGEDLDCSDANLCTMESCDSQIGCVYDWAPGCCTSNDDCEDGYYCLLGSNSCIVDPDPSGDGDGDGDGDPTTGDGDGDPTTGDGDGDPTTGDGDGDPSTGDGDGDSGGGSESDAGDESGAGGETGTPFDTFGAVPEDEGCSCTAEERGGGALFGLFGLLLLGLGRRRDD